ncbi:MAG: cytochrome b6-f complex subunit PetN [Planctomycetaceae bacterium]
MPHEPAAEQPASAVAVPTGGIDGFLGTRASLGMDVVLVGLVALLPVLAWSIALVRRGRYAAHKSLQLFIVAALAAAILVFEIDIRLVSDWKPRAAASPWWPGGVLAALGIHLVFAVTTFGLWVWVVWEALARFPVPPAPAAHGPRHRRLARLAAIDLACTAVTGLVFYWLAFVAA